MPILRPGLTPRKTPAAALRELSGKQHLHSCKECRKRTYSCNCTTPGVNERCHTCRLAVSRPIWEAARDIRPCCINNCKQITTTDELTRYKLAGPGPWYQCKICARSHGVYPQQEEEVE